MARAVTCCDTLRLLGGLRVVDVVARAVVQEIHFASGDDCFLHPHCYRLVTT